MFLLTTSAAFIGGIMKFGKIILWLVSIFILGGIAGILGSQLFLPWLAGLAPFSKIDWIVRSRDGVTIINKTERIVVEQSAAYQEIIAKVENSLVGVRAEKIIKTSGKKSVLAEGSGFILTSDGLAITDNLLLPEAANKISVFWGEKQYEAQLVKRDAANNLALIKISESNLPVVALGETDNLKMGEDIFLLGADLTSDRLNKFINRGFLKTVFPVLTVDFFVSPAASGGLLANVKGEVIGLGMIDNGNEVKVVAVDKIREIMK